MYLISFDYCSAPHSAAHTESGESGLGIAPAHFIQKSYQNPTAGTAYGMAEGDGTAVHVQLIQIESEVMPYCHGLCSKRFVRFDQIEITD